jgi:hypothetical protein
VLRTLVAVASGVWILGLGVEAARAEATDHKAEVVKPWWRRAACWAFISPGVSWPKA